MSTPVDKPFTPWMVLRVLCLASLCFTSPLSAQNGDPSDDAGVRFFTGYRFHLNAAALLDDDERFNWDADYGGDIDGRLQRSYKVLTVDGKHDWSPRGDLLLIQSLKT